jgi:hypothetical protein
VGLSAEESMPMYSLIQVVVEGRDFFEEEEEKMSPERSVSWSSSDDRCRAMFDIDIGSIFEKL